MHAYWSTHFILPSSVVKELESMLRKFMWAGVELDSHSSKVAWKEVTLPYDEGGLGIKKIKEWNIAFMGKAIWCLCDNGHKSTWKDWVKANLIRNHTFWQMQIPQKCSWTWRKLLQLRGRFSNHIRIKIGNGEATAFWFDPWLKGGPICKANNDRMIAESGLGKNIRVSDCCSNGVFHWPPPNCVGLLNLQGIPRPSMGNGPDRCIWQPQGTDFSVRLAWQTIREKKEQVPWWHLVWKNPAPPRCRFITWLAFRKRLTTLDMVKHRGVHLANRCALCMEEEESMIHLLSSCSYAKEVWSYFRPNLRRLPCEVGWGEWITWASAEYKGKSQEAKTGRAAFCTIVYHLWRERNRRFHDDRDLTSSLLCGEIRGFLGTI